MRLSLNALGTSVIVATAVTVSHCYAAQLNASESYLHEPMPPGIQVVVTPLEGPVFADAQGHTFYIWPRRQLRNGYSGEVEGKPSCGSEVQKTNAGLESPFPAGLELPELDTRPSCIQVWPPVMAASDAKPIGKWTIVDGPDGRKQWAYNDMAVYMSILDKKPGDTFGGTNMYHILDEPATRAPVGPPPSVPSQFAVHTTMLGRLVTLQDGFSIYTYDRDSRNKSNCTGACLTDWSPILAGDYAGVLGEWTTFERAPGVKQWAFRGMPVYRHFDDSKNVSLDGSDIPGWHNVYTQMSPAPPQGFTMKDTMVGLVLGDSHGMTVYRYSCYDDAADQLACDYPEAAQVHRFTVCGGGDVDRCLKTFPYIVAPAGAKADGHLWSTMYIDPRSGKRAVANQPGALNVWAFRGRPVYTFAGYTLPGITSYGDKTPADINANSWGEVGGVRNGYKAIVYRDVFGRRDQ